MYCKVILPLDRNRCYENTDDTDHVRLRVDE